jgi:hypothetical protein
METEKSVTCLYLVQHALWDKFSPRLTHGCYFEHSVPDVSCELFLHYMVVFNTLSSDAELCEKVFKFLAKLRTRDHDRLSLRCLERVISTVRQLHNNPTNAPKEIQTPDILLACTTYQNNLMSCHKRFFDMYKRQHLVNIVFQSHDTIVVYESSIGQLNFLIWLVTYGQPIMRLSQIEMK